MLKRVGSKNITVDDQRYRYVISEVGVPKGPSVPLALTVQHASTNGSRLRVTGLHAVRVPESESKFYMGRSLEAPILPGHVESLIRSALGRGWQPQVPGRQLIVELGSDVAVALRGPAAEEPANALDGSASRR
jgi:hypothetical protein